MCEKEKNAGYHSVSGGVKSWDCVVELNAGMKEISVFDRVGNIYRKRENTGYQSLQKASNVKAVNPLPHMPILGSSNSAANTDIMSKILTNGDTIF